MDKDSSHAVGFKKGNTHESDSELESESDDTPYTTPATTRKPLNNHLNFTNAHASSSSNTARVPYNGLKMNCHFGTHSSSKIKTTQLWQKSVQSNRKWNSLAWIGMTQHAMQLKFLMQNMKRFKLMML